MQDRSKTEQGKCDMPLTSCPTQVALPMRHQKAVWQGRAGQGIAGPCERPWAGLVGQSRAGQVMFRLVKTGQTTAASLPSTMLMCVVPLSEGWFSTLKDPPYAVGGCVAFACSYTRPSLQERKDSNMKVYAFQPSRQKPSEVAPWRHPLQQASTHKHRVSIHNNESPFTTENLHAPCGNIRFRCCRVYQCCPAACHPAPLETLSDSEVTCSCMNQLTSRLA